MLIGGGNRYLHSFILIYFELISSSRIEDEDCPLESFKIARKSEENSTLDHSAILSSRTLSSGDNSERGNIFTPSVYLPGDALACTV